MNTLQLPLISEPSDSFQDAEPYLDALGISIIEADQKIQFNHNGGAAIHRWSPYVQGFSGQFVKRTLERYWAEYQFERDETALVYDPFAGVGTVLVEAQRMGVRRCIGVELNPLLSFLANTKLHSWGISPEVVSTIWKSLPRDNWFPAPAFLRSERHFGPNVLRNLQIIRGAIELIENEGLRNLFKMAFASILIDCSNLKRTPSLGYWTKSVRASAPWELMDAKLKEICDDLALVQREHGLGLRDETAYVATADAKEFEPGQPALVVTSPPYMNGMDYVMNYKIEMAWLGFIDSHIKAKQIKDKMVACDNVSHRITRDFAQDPDVFQDSWLTEILDRISYNIDHWDEGYAQRRIPRKRKVPRQPDIRPRTYRRRDMPLIVHKYFDDMYRVMRKLASCLQPGGRIVLVLGDSLIADVYVPTDLLIAKMGLDFGLQIESVEKARNRRSGQIRSYKLRESVVTLVKPRF